MELTSVNAWQLCYDGKIVDGMDRYVFIGQYPNINAEKITKVTAPVSVTSFTKDISVTAEAVFKAVVENIGRPLLDGVYSIMADTTALNTGKKTGVNKRLQEYFKSDIGHEVHTIECLFHVNEDYFTHAKQYLEGKVKGPNAFQDGALMNRIKKLPKPKPEDLKAREECKVPTTLIAVNYLKAKTA